MDNKPNEQPPVRKKALSVKPLLTRENEPQFVAAMERFVGELARSNEYNSAQAHRQDMNDARYEEFKQVLNAHYAELREDYKKICAENDAQEYVKQLEKQNASLTKELELVSIERNNLLKAQSTRGEKVLNVLMKVVEAAVIAALIYFGVKPG